jgi:hypothetical protein
LAIWPLATGGINAAGITARSESSNFLVNLGLSSVPFRVCSAGLAPSSIGRSFGWLLCQAILS